MIRIKTFPLVCVQDAMLIVFGGKIQGVTPLKMFLKKVVRGNAVQIFSNFPAKSLSIYRANFFMTPL